MFKKGDTLRFTNGSIAIVLNNGLNKQELYEQYKGQKITMKTSNEDNINFIVEETFKLPNRFWYEILVGDEKVWALDNILYYRRYGKWPLAS